MMKRRCGVGNPTVHAERQAMMASMTGWNQQQIQTFRRYGRRFGIALTPALVIDLAGQYARKHARERTWASSNEKSPPVRRCA
jgi:hypothetical protein